MANPRGISTITFLLNLVRLCKAVQIIKIAAADPQIRYVKGTTNTTSPSWGPIHAHPTVCPTPQEATQTVGDYAVFTFTGTEITVFGTIGVKRGILGFSLDGQNTTFDRTKPSGLECNHAIFRRTNLPLQKHTFVATLLQKQPALDTGPDIGILSIQHISFTAPDVIIPKPSDTSKSSRSQTSVPNTNTQQTSTSQSKSSAVSDATTLIIGTTKSSLSFTGVTTTSVQHTSTSQSKSSAVSDTTTLIVGTSKSSLSFTGVTSTSVHHTSTSQSKSSAVSDATTLSAGTSKSSLSSTSATSTSAQQTGVSQSRSSTVSSITAPISSTPTTSQLSTSTTDIGAQSTDVSQSESSTIPDTITFLASDASRSTLPPTSVTGTDAQQTDGAQSKNSDNKLPTIIGASIGSGFAVLIAIALLIFCRRRRRFKSRNDPGSFSTMGYIPSSVLEGSHYQRRSSAINRAQSWVPPPQPYPEPMGEMRQAQWTPPPSQMSQRFPSPQRFPAPLHLSSPPQHLQAPQHIPAPQHTLASAQPLHYQAPGFAAVPLSRSNARRESISTYPGSPGPYVVKNPDFRPSSAASGQTSDYGTPSIADSAAARLGDLIQGRAAPSSVYVPPPGYEPKREDTHTPILRDPHNRHHSTSSEYSEMSSNIVNNARNGPPHRPALHLDTNQRLLAGLPMKAHSQQGAMHPPRNLSVQSPLPSVAEVSPERNAPNLQPERYLRDRNRAINTTSLADQPTLDPASGWPPSMPPHRPFGPRPR